MAEEHNKMMADYTTLAHSTARMLEAETTAEREFYERTIRTILRRMGWLPPEDSQPLQDPKAEAEAAFNAVLEMDASHLVMLRKRGWIEDPPGPDAWYFRHRQYPGVQLIWDHGTHKGRAV